MSIFPLPVFETDSDPRHRSALTDQEQYERLEPPKSIVVRFGVLKQVAEYPHDGDARPGCGSKLVARTHRGTEIVEMLTTTCENAGCAKSVTRKEMLEYIDASGGDEYPFHTKGRVLRVATIEDLNKDTALKSDTREATRRCKTLIAERDLPMRLVEVEPILGEELLTFYFLAEDRVDFRDLVRDLAAEFKTRIEMRQVGARDEARIVADYERCGQHCCCKSFLKVLKPVSMKAAKLQKATLDPLKISGRCGRLMCCLRYEDQTYRELKKKLPPRNSRVGTTEGPGTVVETRILVQLARVRLDDAPREIAVPIEELLDPETCPRPHLEPPPPPERPRHEDGDRSSRKRPRRRGGKGGGEGTKEDPLRGMSPEAVARKIEVKPGETRDDTDTSRKPGAGGRKRRRRRRGKSGEGTAEPDRQRQDEFRQRSESSEESGSRSEDRPADDQSKGTEAPQKKRKRRRRRRSRRPEGGASS